MLPSPRLFAYRVNEQKTNPTTLLPEQSENERDAALSTIILLSLLTGASVFAKFFRAIVHLIFSMKISRNIHSALVKGIIYARVQFFDNNLIGNILNRFSRDIGQIDEVLPHVVGEVIKVQFSKFKMIEERPSLNVFFSDDFHGSKHYRIGGHSQPKIFVLLYSSFHCHDYVCFILHAYS